ncbi:MAG: glutathione S-transferase C-terminal domain-containing protein [Polyangiales bacterium]
MGQLIAGVWHPGWYPPNAAGAFERPKTVFRGRVTAVTPGRYHLYVALACPWAHRTLITRALRGLEGAVGVTVVDPRMGEDGWSFRPDDPDPVGGARFLREVYLRADPAYTGRVTVPVLWDREAGAIVNNESREVMRMLDLDFAPLAEAPLVDTLCPPELRAEVDRALDAIYEPINNGVYRAGFAKTQAAYEGAVDELFRALARWDEVLSGRPFTCGERMTEADVALFTTCLRFDLVYYAHFKCNVRRLRDHPHLWRFTRRMWQHPGVRATCALDDIKTHYYWSQDHVNPTRIVPAGPAEYERDLDSPLG